jgi:hypothetical protein
MARVVAADERHHLFDGEERTLEQETRPQHAQRLEVARRRGADLAQEQVSEPRGRQIDVRREAVDRKGSAEALFHGGEGRFDARVHPVRLNIQRRGRTSLAVMH